MSGELVLSAPGFGKTDSFRRFEGSVWEAMFDVFFYELGGNTIAGAAGGAALGGTVYGVGASFLNAFFGTDIKVTDAIQTGMLHGGIGGAALALTQVDWPGIYRLVGASRVEAAVGKKAGDLQHQRTIELQLKDLGCDLNSSRDEVERKYQAKILESEKQDANTASVSKLIYATTIKDIRSWFDSRSANVMPVWQQKAIPTLQQKVIAFQHKEIHAVQQAPIFRIRDDGQRALDEQRISRSLMEFGCTLTSSRAEFERKYEKTIANSKKQDASRDALNKLLMELRAKEIRAWYDSRGDFS